VGEFLVNLYTSNSRLKQIAIASITVLLVYNAWLVLSPPTITHYHNQWIKNRAKAEQYLYTAPTADVIVVGSSLAARLIADEISNNAAILAFAGAGLLR